jgi:hypothetical protein
VYHRATIATGQQWLADSACCQTSATAARFCAALRLPAGVIFRFGAFLRAGSASRRAALLALGTRNAFVDCAARDV